jgi:DNA repair exonuclease SbcCD nuclease subunit
MSKIGICADPHITDRHRCRQDNFLETVIKKLDYIAANNDFVLILGDLFHTCSNSNYIFYRIYKLMTKHKGKFIAIPGNHDLLHNNLSALDRTTLGSLALTGALRLELKNFEIDNAKFQVSHVLKDIPSLPVDTNNEKILIGHNYVEPLPMPKETFTKEELRELNYKLIFLGHDHQPYEEEMIGNSILIRMGNLTRIDTQPYNMDRKIYYYQLDSVSLEYERLEVPCESSEFVFTEEAFRRTNSVKEDITFIKIGDVLSKFKKKQGGINSIDERLKKIASQQEIDYIRMLHELNNVRYF